MYFLACGPALARLQEVGRSMQGETPAVSPLLRDIACPSPSPEPSVPAYLAADPYVDVSALIGNGMDTDVSFGRRRVSQVVEVLDRGCLPGCSLDPSQQHAVCTALCNRVALIQGPPGTGKTFTSKRLIKLLLSCEGLASGPVLILTQKNHALDQLLLGLLELNALPRSEMCRIGGRGSPKLADLNINVLVQNDRHRVAQHEYERVKAAVGMAVGDAVDCFQGWLNSQHAILDAFLSFSLDHCIVSMFADCPTAVDELSGWSTVASRSKKKRKPQALALAAHALRRSVGGELPIDELVARVGSPQL